jgi:hypothetical protein
VADPIPPYAEQNAQRRSEYSNVSSESGFGLPGAGSGAGEGFTADAGFGVEQVGGRPLTLQEKYNRYVLPKERDRLSTFLGERQTAQQNQQVAQSGRNDELSRRLGISGTAQSSVLGSALSSQSAEAQARSGERARSQFDNDIQGFRANELNRLATPTQNVTDAEIFNQIFQGAMEIIGVGASAASGGGGSSIPKIDVQGDPSQQVGFVDGNAFAGAGQGGSGLDTLSSTFAQRASGGGIGRVETEEERRRRMGLV